MSLIQPNPPAETSPSTWQFTWADSGGPYRVFYRGQLVAIVSAAEITIFEPEGHVPSIEVATSADDVPEQVKHPGRVYLQWRHPLSGPDLDHYRVDQLVGETWTPVATVAWRPGQYHGWTSQHLEDDATHQHRVVPVTADGHDLTAAEHAVTVVRHPDTPRVSYAVAAGTLTVSAA